jgi:hypothetical protein
MLVPMSRKKRRTAPQKPSGANPWAGKVMVATLSPGTVTTQYARSVATLCLTNPAGALAGVNTVRTARSFMGRNQAIQEFLASPLEWLLWIDSDMDFTPDAFATLYQEATTNPEAKIVTGLCFMYDADSTTIFPNIFYQQEDGSYGPEWQYEPDSRFWCDATGVAFTLIHRSVFEAVGYPWHQDWIIHPETGHPMGHDISFYHKARKHGFRVRYCADAKVSHVKTWAIGETAFMRQLELHGLEPGAKDEQ